MPNVKSIYMIRQKSTGLFAKSGTSDDRWSKKGKIFDRANLINHMKQFDYKGGGGRNPFPYPNDDTEILEIKVDLDVLPTFNPSEFLGGADRD